jgi:hypothetical protein
MNTSQIPETKPPAWVYDRIRAAGQPGAVRYEASLYGPLNAFLSAYFPPTQWFLVKPQPKIRPEYLANPGETPMRLSVDSYGASVLPRSIGGAEYPLKSPDFIVAKATEQVDGDRILLIVEAKPQDGSEEHAREQLSEYMETFAEKYHAGTGEPLTEVVRGLLIIGGKVSLLSVPINGQAGWTDLTPFTHVAVHTFIRDIVTRNW